MDYVSQKLHLNPFTGISNKALKLLCHGKGKTLQPLKRTEHAWLCLHTMEGTSNAMGKGCHDNLPAPAMRWPEYYDQLLWDPTIWAFHFLSWRAGGRYRFAGSNLSALYIILLCAPFPQTNVVTSTHCKLALKSGVPGISLTTFMCLLWPSEP